MLALAVVGPIVSGKSMVLGILREYGAVTLSADHIARELTCVGQPALRRIFAEFGERYRTEDGSLNRAALADLIFRSTEARARLEGILHPAILVRIDAWLTGLRDGDTPPRVAAVEVLRLPRRLRAREHFDVVWLCSAPEAVRLRRLMTRDGVTESDARRRFDVQRSQHVEDCEPDLILDTDCSIEELRERVRRAWDGLVDGPLSGPEMPNARRSGRAE